MPGNKTCSNKKANTLFCTKSELLEEIGKVVGEMWNGCQHCECCFKCEKYSFILNQFQNQDLTHKFPNNLWCVYINTNEYNFEIEHVFVQHY